MRIFALLLSTFVFAFASCEQFELEKDESFELRIYNGAFYLGVHSSDFDASFSLFCPPSSQVYAKRLIKSADTKGDSDSYKNALQIHLSSNDINTAKIQIQNRKERGFLTELLWSYNDKRINAKMQNDALFLDLNANAYQSDTQNISTQSIAPTLARTVTLGNGFVCSPNYFKQTFQQEALVFAEHQINASTILAQISRLTITGKDPDNTKLLKWLTDCNRWVRLVKNNHSQTLENIDYQLLTQSTKLTIKTQNLLTALQKHSLQNLPVNATLHEGFLDSMKALKNLEKEKSSKEAFAQIHHLFFISSHTSSPAKELTSILQNLQDGHYYSLLSNQSIQTLIEPSEQNIRLAPHHAYAYALDSQKQFFVLHTISAMELATPSAQLVTYELSNSFCTYLKIQIENSNQALHNKIQLLDYCSQKILATKAIATAPSSNFGAYAPPSAPQNTASVTQVSTPRQEPATASGTCESVSDKVQFCHNVPKSNVVSYLKDGFDFPSLEDLENNFDDPKYFGVHVHTADGGYYFFNEDIGWEYLNKLDYEVLIDLILIR